MSKTRSSSVLASAALAAGLAVFAGAGVAQATVIDPQLFVGPPGTNSPPGGTAIGGESNLLTGNAAGTGFSVGVAGNHTMQKATPSEQSGSTEVQSISRREWRK